MEKDSITCPKCTKSYNPKHIEQLCSNCFACCGCLKYLCPVCNTAIVVKEIKEISYSKNKPKIDATYLNTIT